MSEHELSPQERLKEGLMHDPDVAEPAMHGLAEGAAGGRMSHPPGLYLLFVVEMWERFSYYGMRALLVLFMVAEIAGTGVGGTGGGLGFSREEAGKVYGWYTSLVYLTPVFGGMLADKLIGTHRSMVIGGIIIVLGHVCLGVMDFFRVPGATEAAPVAMQIAFATGLALIILGTGFFKPCVSVMVGQLYGEGDKRRDAGFTIYYMGINLGAFTGTLMCAWLASTFGWSVGFGAAAVGMLAGLIAYGMGRPKFLKGVGLPPEDHEPAPRVLTKLGGAILALAIPVAIYAVLGMLAAAPPEERASWLRFAEGLSAETAATVRLVYFLFLIAAVLGGVVMFTMRQAKHERGPTAALFIIAFFVIFFWYAFEQAGSSMNVFAQQRTSLTWRERQADGVIESTRLGDKWKGMEETTFGWLRPPIGDAGGAHGAGGSGESPHIVAARENPFNVGKGTIRTVLRDGREFTFEVEPETTVGQLAAQMAGQTGGALTLTPTESNTGVVLRDSTTGGGLLVEDARGSPARDLRIHSASEIAAAQFQSLNPLYILIFAPVFAILWVRMARRGVEPSTPLKMAYGLIMLGLGFVFMVIAGKFSDSGVFIAPNATESGDGAVMLSRVGAQWLVLAYLLHTWGELCLSPIGLSLTTKLAPRKWVSFMMGVWFLAPSIAQLIGGYTFAYIEPIETGDAAGFPILGGQADFFLIFVITSVGAGVVLLLITPIMKRLIGGRG